MRKNVSSIIFYFLKKITLSSYKIIIYFSGLFYRYSYALSYLFTNALAAHAKVIVVRLC